MKVGLEKIENHKRVVVKALLDSGAIVREPLRGDHP